MTKSEKIKKAKFIDLLGKRFKFLTVIKYWGFKKGQNWWISICDCGKECIKSTTRTIHGISCGCKRLASKKSLVEKIFKQYKKHALERNLHFNLSIEQLEKLIFNNCFYCGIEPSNKISSSNKKLNIKYNGIDRKNNHTGYNISNCVPCCYNCNRSKNNQSIEEFEAWLNNLVKHQLKTYPELYIKEENE